VTQQIVSIGAPTVQHPYNPPSLRLDTQFLSLVCLTYPLYLPIKDTRETPGHTTSLTMSRSGLSDERTQIGVIGGGAWGTALGIHCARMGHNVLLWAREPEVS
jgi:hypothetical protein